MVLKDILSISGESGLFRFIAQGKNAIIIEHLESKKRSSAFASAKVISLDEISVFTEEEDVSLSKVFDLIFDKEKGGPAIDSRSDSDKLKQWFSEVLPEYDRDRVYVSDIKKISQWYNILHELKLLVKEEPEQAETNALTEKETDADEQAVEQKPEKIEAGAKKSAGAKKNEKTANTSGTKSGKKRPVSEAN